MVSVSSAQVPVVAITALDWPEGAERIDVAFVPAQFVHGAAAPCE